MTRIRGGMKGLAARAGMAAALVATGLLLVPTSLRHWQIVASAGDPVALSELRLDQALDRERVSSEIDFALAARDGELARSFVALAQERAIPVAPQRIREIEEFERGAALRAVGDFGHGFLKGDRDGGAAFSGALAGDLTGFGDLRDLALEGRKWLEGGEPDRAVLILAGAGLALTAATVASIGAALPARQGVSLIKGARKARILSPKLAADMARLSRGALDGPALKTTFAAAARLDLAGMRVASAGLVKPAALRSLAALGQDAGAIYGKVGTRGLRQALAVADDAGDLRRAAALAIAKGGSTRAILKVLGRGALVLGALSLGAVGWLFTLLGWALAAAMFAQRLGWWLGRRRRPGWPRPAALQTATP
jgi:hypothetical protein